LAPQTVLFKEYNIFLLIYPANVKVDYVYLIENAFVLVLPTICRQI